MMEALAALMAGDPDWEWLAPAGPGAAAFRLRPRGWPADDPRLGPLNARLRAAVTATGEVRLSRARVDGRVGLRLATGPRGSRARTAEQAWAVLRAEALRLGATPPVIARRAVDGPLEPSGRDPD